jgi:cellulose synthase/poly-beta-1,6-N-acetylglucosamine synthase-like glycosyltransferase
MELLGLDAMAVNVLPCLPAPKHKKSHGHSQNRNLLHELQCLEYEQAMRLGRGAMYAIETKENKYRLKYAEVTCVSGAFGIFRSTVLKEAMTRFPDNGENFDGEDLERTLKILALRGNVGYAEDIVVLTSIPVTVVSHFKQRHRWAAGTIRCFLSKFGAATLKRKRAGAAYVTCLIRDILLLPLKVFYFPSLVLCPIYFLSMMSFYYVLNIFMVKRINSNITSTEAILLLPVYRLYLLFPTATGYLGGLLHIIEQKILQRKLQYTPLEIIKAWNYVDE